MYTASSAMSSLCRKPGTRFKGSSPISQRNLLVRFLDCCSTSSHFPKSQYSSNHLVESFTGHHLVLHVKKGQCTKQLETNRCFLLLHIEPFFEGFTLEYLTQLLSTRPPSNSNQQRRHTQKRAWRYSVECDCASLVRWRHDYFVACRHCHCLSGI